MTNYFSLTKPRMVLGNAIVAVAAFIFGSYGAIDWVAFCYMFAGLWLVMASACAVNNYYDREIDVHMERTRERALPAGTLQPRRALMFAAVLLVLGILLLTQTNFLAVMTAAAGFVAYALLYTPLKHKTGYAFYVGAVSGALPPLVGYAAASGRLDMTAGMLFVFLFVWQLPHFWAIAVYRFDEYAAAGVPLLARRPKNEAARQQARKVFYASLIVLLAFCALLILQRWMR